MSPVGEWCERAGHRHLPLSSAEVTNEWNYTSTNMGASIVNSGETESFLCLCSKEGSHNSVVGIMTRLRDRLLRV
jgi:hypothetical protein